MNFSLSYETLECAKPHMKQCKGFSKWAMGAVGKLVKSNVDVSLNIRPHNPPIVYSYNQILTMRGNNPISK